MRHFCAAAAAAPRRRRRYMRQTDAAEKRRQTSSMQQAKSKEKKREACLPTVSALPMLLIRPRRRTSPPRPVPVRCYSATQPARFCAACLRYAPSYACDLTLWIAICFFFFFFFFWKKRVQRADMQIESRLICRKIRQHHYSCRKRSFSACFVAQPPARLFYVSHDRYARVRCAR